MDNSKLAAKVRAVNAANAYGLRLYEELAPIFRPLVGAQILKVDGQLLGKYAKLMPKLPCEPRIHVYRRITDYSLAWTVKTCESYPNGDGCFYHETTIYMGELEGQTLKKLSEPQELKTDYRAEPVEIARAKYRLAEQAYRDAQSALFPFGEYDR